MGGGTRLRVFVTVQAKPTNLNIVSTYLNDLNQRLKNYYGTNEMKLSGGVQIFKITVH